MHVHILGICGTLMGSIALLARALGHGVSGSDENVYPPMSDQLKASGIPLSEGYLASNIPADVDLVMIGNAGLPRGNEAVEYVLDKGIPYTSGAEWLGRYLLHDRWVIAIAGTHGKTSTTSMVAHILEFAGLSPGFLIGGVPSNFTESARLGETPFFVIEADEYDTSYFDRRSKFLHYHPRTLVLNNLEYDHADIFPDLAAIEYQFHLLLRTIPSSGLIVYDETDDNLKRVLAKGRWTPRLPLNTERNDKGLSAVQISATNFQVLLDGGNVGEVNWTLSGTHNVSNALAAIGAARHVGVSPEVACEALGHFSGVKRRMELIFEGGGIFVYDDFAHHPTAIKTTLEGVRARVGSDSIVAVIEPKSHTMAKGTHEDTLSLAVEAADQAIWFRPANVSWEMEARLTNKHSRVYDTVEQIISDLVSNAHARQHIVVMSNGSFEGLREELVSRFTKAFSK